jgi:hypothetical protein
MSKNIIGPCPDNFNGICKKGEILRTGYVKVKPTCIKDQGKPGKGPKLIVIPKEDIGLLEKYNYTLKNNYEERIKSLKKANKELSKLKVLRYINALRTLQKSNEKYYNKLDRDMKWLQKNYYN